MRPQEIPLPAQYLPTGDHALIVGWHDPVAVVGGMWNLGEIRRDRFEELTAYLKDVLSPKALVCLEDGTPKLAGLDELKFDYRYDVRKGKFVDVSGYGAPTGEDDSANADQADADDGGQGVPGLVPEPD